MRWIVLCVVALMALPWLIGCSQESVAEREIARRAPDYIGPADRYQADVQGLSDTRADVVSLTGRGVRPISELRIDSLTLTLRDLQYQREPFRILSVGQSAFTARLTDRAINDYLRATSRTGSTVLRDAQVSFLPNEVRATATLTVAGEAVSMTTAGALQPQGALVNYVPQRLVVGGVLVPEGLLPQIAALVNPIIDLRGLRFTPQITQITPSSGAVTLSGNADVRQLIGPGP